MNETAQKTLFHPFEAGLLELDADARVLVLGAPADMRLPSGFPRSVVAVQGFRPAWLALKARGFDVRTQPAGETFDAALVLCGRFRASNETMVGEALRHVRPGGLTVVGGAKQDGIQSLRKRVAALLAVEDHASKHHGIVFWLERPEDADAERAALALEHGPVEIEDGFVTGPGMFSSDAVDPASSLLADNLPDRLAGDFADFCAGWGYLAARAAAKQGVKSIDLYEADLASLEAAKTNLSGRAVPIGFHWQDLLSEPVARRYDVVVMNPPFHDGRAADPQIGTRMIGAAAAALRKNGVLYLVANRQLPYEREMAARFAAHGELASDARFKVLWGRR